MPPGQSAWEGHGVQASPEPHAQRAGVEDEEEEEDAKLERTAEQASGGA